LLLWAVAVAVAVFGAAILAKFPRLMLILTIAFQMVNLVAIRLLGDSGSLTLLVQVVAIGACFVIYLNHRESTQISKTSVLIAFLVIYGVVLSTSMAPLQLQILSAKLFLFPFVFFLLRCSPSGYLRPVFSAFCWLTCLNSVAALFEKMFGVAALHALGLQYGTSVRTINGQLRSPGLLPTNFDLGLVCAVAFIFCFYTLFFAEGVVSRNLARLTLLASGVGLIASTTRSALVMVIIALLVLLSDAAISTAKRLVAYLALALGLSYVIFSRSNLGSSASLGQRQGVWSDLIQTYGGYAGLGFGRVGGITYSSYNVAGVHIFVDNYFLSLYLQLGFCGLLAFFGCLVALFRGTQKFGAALFAGLIASFAFLETWEYSLPMSMLVMVAVSRSEPTIHYDSKLEEIVACERQLDAGGVVA
jgi:hypothetical protein